MNFYFNIAVITGAASGIGRSTAHLFAKEGYPLLLIDVDEKNLNELVDELTKEQHFKKVRSTTTKYIY